METDQITECNVCKKTFKQILRHLSLAKKCQDKYPSEEIDRLKDLSRKRKTHYLKEYHKAKKSERLEKMKQNHKEKGPERAIKKKQNHAANRTKRLESMKQRDIKKKEEISNAFKMKKELFFKEIQYGPIFPCVCCNRDLFQRGVNVVTPEFVQQLVKDSLDPYVRLDTELKVNDQHYICKNCYSILKNKKKMPNICFQNGLGLSHVPDCLKLTDIENHLISKNLIFIKVRPSPRSRYAEMENKIVNVPIPDEDIIKSVTSL